MLASQSESCFFPPATKSVNQCFILCLFLFPSKEVFFSADFLCSRTSWSLVVLVKSGISSILVISWALIQTVCVYLTDGPFIGQSGILSIPVKSWALRVPIPVVHFVHQSGIFCIPVTTSCLSVPMLIVDLLVTVGYFPYKSWLLSETTCVPVPVVHLLTKVGLTALWDYMCSCASCPLVDQSGIFCIPVTVNFLAAFLSPC